MSTDIDSDGAGDSGLIGCGFHDGSVVACPQSTTGFAQVMACSGE